jgi:glutathione S-transferase
MIELLQFRYSPYNEKVRWALDFKRVPHRRASLLPGPHMGRVRALTGRTQTPVMLLDDGRAIDGSASILDWIESRYPSPALAPALDAERAAAREIERRFDEDIAPRGRRAVLATLLRTPRYFARVFGDGRGALSQLAYAAALPLASPLIRKGNGIARPASVEDGLAAFVEGFDFVAARIGGSGYLVGDRFSRADLAAASVLAVAVDPPDSPMTRPLPRAAPFDAFVARFAAHPGAAWVREMYRRHRARAADFDGPSTHVSPP